ncbi:MAG: FHA domain-containing protein [Roseburia sp.]|nr:FHA domain-containing protein [Roseburia sp.]
MIDKEASGLEGILDADGWDDEESKKQAEEFDEIIEKGEDQTGINLSSLSGIEFISMDTNALFIGNKDYDKESLEKIKDDEDVSKIKTAIVTYKILLAIVYFGAIVILVLTLLSFFLKWGKYIMAIISSGFGLIVSIIFAICRWGIPAKIVDYSSGVTDEAMTEFGKMGIEFFGSGEELIEQGLKLYCKAIIGMGVMTCFILGILLLVMGIVTCIVGKAPAVYIDPIPDPGPIFPPLDPPPVFSPFPPVKPEPKPIVKPEPPKPKYGRVKCTQGIAVGQGFKLPEDRKVIVGKSPQNATLVIHDQHISNVHCSIRYCAETDSYIVTDHSTNGTFVHGVRLAKDIKMEYPAGTVLSLADGSNKITLG